MAVRRFGWGRGFRPICGVVDHQRGVHWRTTRNASSLAWLSLAGRAGGSAAVWHSLRALELLADPRGPATDGRMITALDGVGRRPRVAILGAGIGGLSAAYELEQAGYEVVILEASHRIGGRNFTVRAGTVIDELGNRQVCDFDDDPDLYFNAGPARIPAVHHRLMHYCREFRIPLEPFINSNYNAWVTDAAINGGERVRQRDVIADARGFMAELAAKGLGASALDAPLDKTDREKLHDYVRAFGDLDSESMRYRGSGRAGFLGDGMLDPVALKPHGSLQEVVESKFASIGMLFAENEYQAPSMMQPVGGMDRVVDAFVERLRGKPLTRARVTGIYHESDAVRIVYEQAGEHRALRADYCLNAIPGHLMAGMQHNLSASYTGLIRRIDRGMLSKVGLQMSRRFWEEEDIYGGISWTDHPVLQVWYPSHGAHRDKGVVLGAYIFNQDHNAAFGRLSHAQRLASAIEAGEALHPGSYRRHIETGVSVVWHRMNHLLGCGGGVGDPNEPFATEPDRIRTALLAGDGRHFMIGDQVSKHPGWQEGALAVTERVLQTIHRRELEKQVAGRP